jgi:predicted GNAT superfamily acetyltransferase
VSAEGASEKPEGSPTVQAAPAIRVEQLSTHDQFQHAVDLQRTIWGFAEIELLPVRLFVVAHKVGGQALGAYDGDRMIGFCLAIPGLKPGGGYYLHSHMLGVLSEYRNHGVGRMLKLAQRDEALSRSIHLVEWTFDPLELKNAYFNIERLGAIVRRYVPNQYGITTSALHGGLPTDRCVAEWWIDSERVSRTIAGTRSRFTDVQARITLPISVAEIRRRDAGHAREIQSAARDQFSQCFGRGLAVQGFELSDQEGTYLLGPLASGTEP